MTIRSIINNILLVVVIIFAYKFFQSTPYQEIFFKIQILFYLSLLTFVIFYLFNLTLNRRKIDKTVFYFLFLLFCVPPYSAYIASVEFGQPYIYGLLAERSWVTIVSGILIYYRLSINKTTFLNLEFIFLLFGWGSLFIFSLFILTFDASQLQNTDEISSLATMSQTRGIRFKFQTYFITFGAIYYFIKYLSRKNYIDLFYMLIFLLYIILIIQSRTQMITIMLTFFLFFFFSSSRSRIITNLIGLFVLLALVFLFTEIFQLDFYAKMLDSFNNMFTVLSGELTDEHSANARVYESLIVINYFIENPHSIFFGTGAISHQWNNGYSSLLGYFYPIDIGILGGIFVYGLLGFVVICLIPLMISVKLIKNIGNDTIFVTSIKYLLVYAIIKSIHGYFYFNLVTYIVPLFILLAYKKNYTRKRNVT